MITTEHLGLPDHIIITLAHLLPIDGDHIVMDPVTHGCHMIADGALCNLTFMMGKQKIHTATVNVELLPKIFRTHCRALNMPAGKANAPGRFPSHDMLRRSIFPQS